MKLNPEHPNPLPPRIYCSKDLNKTILQKFPQLLKNWTILLGASMLLFQFPKVYSHPLRGPRIIQPNATTMTSTQYKNLQKSLLQSSAVGNFRMDVNSSFFLIKNFCETHKKFLWVSNFYVWITKIFCEWNIKIRNSQNIFVISQKF